jgi:hypothetical protein
MADGRQAPSYGTPNWDMIQRWFAMPPEEDTEFWAVNLMKYREVARYADGRDTAATGKEADDAYSPLGPLAAIGAVPVFHADVAEQRVGSPVWDRIGIVRYPSRAAFFAMQQRDDFKEAHTHKEAGMDTTIVMACHPTAHTDGNVVGTLVMTVEHLAGGASPPADLPGVTTVADLSVEGVIVGDERTWDRVRVARAADAAAVDAVLTAAAAAEDAFAMVLSQPSVDRLVESIVTRPTTVEG